MFFFLNKAVRYISENFCRLLLTLLNCKSYLIFFNYICNVLKRFYLVTFFLLRTHKFYCLFKKTYNKKRLFHSFVYYQITLTWYKALLYLLERETTNLKLANVYMLQCSNTIYYFFKLVKNFKNKVTIIILPTFL